MDEKKEINENCEITNLQDVARSRDIIVPETSNSSISTDDNSVETIQANESTTKTQVVCGKSNEAENIEDFNHQITIPKALNDLTSLKKIYDEMENEISHINMKVGELVSDMQLPVICEGASNPDNVSPEMSNIPGVSQTIANLRQYYEKVQDELTESKQQPLEDVQKKQEIIVNVRNEIGILNETEARMKSEWIELEQKLKFVSESVTSLQQKSVKLSKDLAERMIIRDQLVQHLDDVDVADLIPGIMDYDVTDEQFLTRWQEFNTRFTLMTEESFDSPESFDVIKTRFLQLRMIAMIKMKTYLVKQIENLGRTKINIYLRHEDLLKHKGLYAFLLSAEPSMTKKILEKYTNIMHKAYHSFFKFYIEKVTKMQSNINFTKDDLIGVEDIAEENIFYFDHRENILDSEKLCSPVSSEYEQGNKHAFEVIFKNIQFTLVYNSCHESSFISEFFLLDKEKTSDLLYDIMEESLGLLQMYLIKYIPFNYDSVSIFLCFQLSLRYKNVCCDEDIAVLNPYWNFLQETLLDRFIYVINLNIRSIQEYNITEINLELGKGYHFITKRYAKFCAALFGINECFPNEVIVEVVNKLQQEIQVFISRMAERFCDRKDVLIFTINNYDIISSEIVKRLKERSKVACGLRKCLKMQLREYAEDVLYPYFQEVMDYVKQYENFMKTSQMDEMESMTSKSMEIVQQFTANWRSHLKELYEDTLSSFLNLPSGFVVFKAIVNHLVEYLDKFYSMLLPEVRIKLVCVSTILVELEKYKTIQKQYVSI